VGDSVGVDELPESGAALRCVIEDLHRPITRAQGWSRVYVFHCDTTMRLNRTP
jgi:hypothetical protein